MIIGMDFGTTNTGAATYDGRKIRMLPLDPANTPSSICRTSIYITRTKEYYLGSPALSLYFNQNIGRPTRYRKVWIGEIQQVFAELPTFYRDVYVYEDEFSPGRLFLSIKTALRNPEYNGTVFQGNWYSATDLVAIFLSGMKMRMEASLGRPVTDLVLGRPVRFSDKPEEDRVAQSRLLEAAFQAGFERIYLDYEPVAAALSYERTIRGPQTVLVFDFGGGTLDFTIIEIGDPKRRRVLATGGIPIAGDIFDQRLFRAAIPKHLGEGDTFQSGGVSYPIPAHIFDLLTTPQEVLSLNTPQNLEMLRAIHTGALHKEKTQALLSIVSSNYALYLFDLVERAKCELSSQTDTVLTLQGNDFAVQETITRLRFEHAIRHEYEAVRRGLEELLSSAGLAAGDIQRVIRTGGSSQIPLFTRLLHRMFGYHKVQEIDIFSSVTSGLAIRGYEIENGMASLPVFQAGKTRNQETITNQKEQNLEVERIDLDAVRHRIEVTQQYQEGQAGLPGSVLAVLTPQGLQLLPADAVLQAGLGPDTSPPRISGLDPDAQTARLARLEEHFLVATDDFKLISVPVRATWIAQQAAAGGIRDLLLLNPGESVTAITTWKPGAWDPGQIGRRSLVLVTRTGQARAFEARLLAEHLGKTPFFQLERRYTAFPAALVFLEEGQFLLVGTNIGRAGRAARRDIAVQVYDVLKTRRGEIVTAAAPGEEESEALALSSDGAWLSADLSAISTSGPPASRGLTLRRNFTIIAWVSPSQMGNLAILTSQGRIIALARPAAAFHIPTLKLAKNEVILSLL